MRLEKFILQEKVEYGSQGGRTTKIDGSRAVELVRSKCLKTFKKWHFDRDGLFRGNVSIRDDYGFVQPSKHSRKSANTENYYTIIIDSTPKFKSYPDRSKSLVCSNHWYGAYSSGGIYLVLPFDGSKIGRVNTVDFWEAFNWSMDFSLELFNYYLEEFLKEVHGKTPSGWSKDYKTMMKELNKAWKMFLGMTEPEKGKIIYRNKLAKIMNENGETFESYFNRSFDPAPNNIKLLKAGSDDVGTGYGASDKKECWTDGNCVLIHYDIVQPQDISGVGGSPDRSAYNEFAKAVLS